MNTPQTMASRPNPDVARAGYICVVLIGMEQLLGCGSLVVAAGVSFFYAKKTIIERRQMQEVAGQRPSEKLECTSFDLGSFLKHHVSHVGVLYDAGRARSDQQEKKASIAQSSTSIGTSSAVDVGSAGKGLS